ncbi:VWA domain-containing protein [Burkholderia sp. Ac-20365]|uniref:vWA domain-containing protein n=1 Tax=Burkholderia sp. Ac-20365 TaxID=2703897 RepID=UPI00197C428E|nr:VWA domain-containing protein [Burkholderia sp. Ac-20365]MBN3767568.1 VWA domain-containing protein [Burkholderia sp. Ac-20365]
MKTLRRTTRAARRERGSVSILVAVSLVALLGVAGLAIDAGLGYMIKARLDSAVDGALIAAGQAVTRGASQAEQITNATTAANAFFAANYPQGFLGSTATLSAPSVNISKGTVTIDLDAQASVPLTLMQIQGFKILNVATSGEAIRRDLDMSFVVDVTSSMSDTTTQAAVRAGSVSFLNNFNTSTDRVSLMHFATGTVVDVPFKSDQSRGFDRTTMTNKINGYSFGGNTNSVEGLWNAKYQLDHVITQPSSLRVIVFFSDGAPNSFSAKFPIATGYTCSSNTNTIKSGDDKPVLSKSKNPYGDNPGGLADMSKQSANMTGGCYDANANNIANLPANYDLHAAQDADSVIPIITNSPRVVNNQMPYINPANNTSAMQATNFTNVQIKYQNVNRASRNLLEAMASKARDEGIYVFALGYGPYLTVPKGPDNEYGQDILKCIANVADGPSRCYNPKQPVGVYCYAATVDAIKPCYAQLASAILRIAR